MGHITNTSGEATSPRPSLRKDTSTGPRLAIGNYRTSAAYHRMYDYDWIPGAIAWRRRGLWPF